MPKGGLPSFANRMQTLQLRVAEGSLCIRSGWRWSVITAKQWGTNADNWCSFLCPHIFMLITKWCSGILVNFAFREAMKKFSTFLELDNLILFSPLITVLRKLKPPPLHLIPLSSSLIISSPVPRYLLKCVFAEELSFRVYFSSHHLYYISCLFSNLLYNRPNFLTK